MNDLSENLKPQEMMLRPRRRLPEWLKKPLGFSGSYRQVARTVATPPSGESSGSGLKTVCVEARCPNRAECFSAGTATFLIMGNACTRDCAFCGVHHGGPQPLDPEEPGRVAAAAASLKLRHIVITSVTRDDLPDGGADHFVHTMRRCRDALPHATVELLIPDLGGNPDALATILSSPPDVLGHNIETVPRLYPSVRPQALYRQSLQLLAAARTVVTKAGLMVGLGETDEELYSVLADLVVAGCRIVTIGQYLRPTPAQIEAVRYVTPERFERYESVGKALGLSSIVAGPFVRSSFHAQRVFDAASRPPSPFTAR
jgi:lipoic acid synthetase